LGLGSTVLLGSLVASLRGATAIIDGRGGSFFVISEHKAAFYVGVDGRIEISQNGNSRFA
jgi:hypothetical protein